MIKLSYKFGKPKATKKKMMNYFQTCYWCGSYLFPTDLYGDKHFATIDHVHPNQTMKRRSYDRFKIPCPVVLSCRECNQNRGNIRFEDYHIHIGKKTIETNKIFYFGRYIEFKDGMIYKFRL